jgi:DNA polymerase-3 subunit epsilon/exodeoxyribonuclease X
MVALDLEGTGSQDRDNEAILEIALVPLAGGRPAIADAWHSLVNPCRRISRRPWISPGLTDGVLVQAPLWDDVERSVRDRLHGKIIVGHNVRVDWRLLHLHTPQAQPAALLDTLRLARHVHPGLPSKSLTALVAEHGLTEQVNALTPGGQPHRALWDTIAVALLLPALVQLLPAGSDTTVVQLRDIAGIPTGSEQAGNDRSDGQLTLGFSSSPSQD